MQFNLDKQKLWGGFLFSVSALVIVFFIRMLMLLEENMMYDYEQVKLRRYGHLQRTMLEQDYVIENKGRRDSPLKKVMKQEREDMEFARRGNESRDPALEVMIAKESGGNRGSETF